MANFSIVVGLVDDSDNENDDDEAPQTFFVFPTLWVMKILGERLVMYVGFSTKVQMKTTVQKIF